MLSFLPGWWLGDGDSSGDYNVDSVSDDKVDDVDGDRVAVGVGVGVGVGNGNGNGIDNLISSSAAASDDLVSWRRSAVVSFFLAMIAA